MERFIGSSESYLEAIYILAKNEGQRVRTTDLAQYMGYTASNISRTIAKLKQEEYLKVDGNGGLYLTQRGRQRGGQIYEKDCFFRDTLILIGVDPDEAAQNACRLKDAVSDKCYAQLRAVLEKAQGANSGWRVDECARLNDCPCKACRINREPEERNRLVQETKAYISQNYAQKFSLQKVAGAMHVDPCYLERTFHAIQGQTLLSFHNHKRCDEACRLLKDAKLNVTEISYRVGYVSPAHFARVFRKIKGQSPSEYRKDYFVRQERVFF